MTGHSRLELARDRLVSHYRYGLRAKVEALVAAVDVLGSSAEAESGIRRVAHQLIGSGASFGHPEITEAARQVESAELTELPTSVAALVAALRGATSAGDLTSRILFVDDDVDLSELVIESIADESTEVVSVGTAAAARRELAAQSFDVVVLDLVLPDDDGRAVLAWLRERPATANVPVIVLSGRGSKSSKTECVALGADGFFEKPADLEVLHASVVATLERRRRLAEEARTDLLTGVLNRAGFCEAFLRLRALCAREETAVSLAIIDVDRFKSINDRLGHAAGDACVVAVANQLTARLRDSDLVCRWGGDEFVVALPGAGAAESAVAFEAIRAALRDHEIPDVGTMAITVSAGVVTVSPHESLSAALVRADSLLYAAKAGGRDRVLSSMPDARTSGSRVLLVEDDPSCAVLVRRLLERDGMTVAHCCDAAEAGAAVAVETFDLVIIDKLIPDLDGFELLADLRGRDSYSRTPILMLTAVGLDADVERAFDLGADDYVQKPFAERQLVARVRRLLRRGEADAAASARMAAQS